MSNAGGICTTAASTVAKEVNIPGFSLYNGVRITVLFTNACTASDPTLNVNGTGAVKIGILKTGYTLPSRPLLKYAYWRGSSSKTYEIWQPGTVLNLIYYNSHWCITGDNVLESYYSTTNSYVVYADGRIEQWGNVTYTTTTQTISLNVAYSSIESYSLFASARVSSSTTIPMEITTDKLSSYQISVGGYNSRGGGIANNACWRTIGY